MTDAELDAMIADLRSPDTELFDVADAILALRAERDEQSAAADMIAEERDAWEKRAKIEATLRLQCANDSQMHLDRALAAEADNAAIRELMNVYNLGGWTDAIAPMQRALKAEELLDRAKAFIDPHALRVIKEIEQLLAGKDEK